MARFEQRRAALRKEQPELAERLAYEARLVRAVLQHPRPPRTPLPALPRERLAARLGAGIPALHEEPLFVDVAFALGLLERLVQTTVEDGYGRHKTAESVREAVSGARVDAQQLFVEAFVQHPEHLAQLAAAGGVDPGTLMHLAELAVAPLRRGYARALEPVWKTMDAWGEGYCPVCGSWPLVADAPTALSRAFRCGACGTSWRAADRRCPFCGTNDPRRVAIAELKRTTVPLVVGVQLCDVCGRYLKLANPIDASPAVLLRFEDLGSRALDDAASARGFERPSGAGFTLQLGLPEPGWSDALAAFDAD
jgi:FdhE protein